MTVNKSSHAPRNKAKSPALPRWTDSPKTPDEALLVALAGLPGEGGHEPLEAIGVRLLDELDAIQQLAEHAEDGAPVARLLWLLHGRAAAFMQLVNPR